MELRRKRIRTTSEFAEASSSRAQNEETGNPIFITSEGDAAPIPTEMVLPSQRSPNFAAENRDAGASAEMDLSLQRNSNTSVVNRHDEASAIMEQRIPNIATEDGHSEASSETDLSLQSNPNTAAVVGHGEASTEPDSVTEVAMEVAPPTEERLGYPVIMDVEDGHAIEDREAGNSMDAGKPSELPCAVGEEDALANHADSINCPICMEPWTGEGTHRICCLACGHLFGRSCIRRWIKQGGKKNGKCPHCNRKARVEDIRNLYVPSLTVIDGGSQQLLEELGVLRIKNQELTAQNDKLNKEFHRLQGLLSAFHGDNYRESNRYQRGKNHGYDTVKEFRPLPPYFHSSDQTRTKQTFLNKYQSTENLQGCFRIAPRNQTKNFIGFGSSPEACGIDIYRRQQGIKALSSHHRGPICEIDGSASQGHFQLQEEFSLLGAKVFDMDSFSQMLLVAQKSSTLGGDFCLNKISLLSLSDAGVVPLPQGTGAVRDIRVAPPGGKLPGRLALVASLGKRISLFSLESNNVVLTYNLQSPCWSCAWDPNEPNHVFAGLQDGSLTIFDLRQTSSPLQSVHGFCRQPVHTLHPVNECNLPQGLRRNGILSACSSGVCFWDLTTLGVQDCRPYAIPCADNHGVCVALAYNHLSNVAVSTFRPKPFEQQSEAPSMSNGIESAESSGLSSQASTQLSLGLHPLRATHVPLLRSDVACFSGGEARHTNQRECVSSNHGAEMPVTEISNINCMWKYGNPMFGNVSPVGMHRSAIVCSSRRESSSDFQSVFAFGDEETCALTLWDVKTLTAVDRLKAHCSPILDVKSMNIGEHSILGCTSVTTLQVYKR